MQQPLLYRPVGGINSTLPADSIGETEVADAVNFLFERQQAVTRPGYQTRVISSIAAQAYFVWGGLPLTDVFIVVTGPGKLYKVTYPGLAVTEITPAAGAFTTFSGRMFQAAGVNGAVLISGDAGGGMVRWVPADATYTIVTAPSYQFVSSHFSRAVAAKSLVGGTGDYTVAWSAAGDETDWASATAGSSVLSDVTGQIQGLGVIDNVVVIPTTHGFHFGYATGVSTPAYRFEAKIRTGFGPAWDSTVCFHNNVCYYVGQHNAYTFDLQTIKPIGDPIREELLRALTQASALKNVTYRGFVSVEGSNTALTTGAFTAAYSHVLTGRAQYNLVPALAQGYDATFNPNLVRPNFPHFAYNIEEGTWSKHRYDFNVVGGCWLQNHNKLFLHDSTATPLIREWDSSIWCESSAYLLSRILIPNGDPCSDFTSQRTLMRYRNSSPAVLGNPRERRVILTVSAKLESELLVASSEQGKDLPFSDDPDWWRTMYDIRVTGNDFQYRVDVPPNSVFALNMLGGKFAPAGQFR